MVRAASEEQLERIDDEALASTGLAGDRVEAGTEHELGLLEEGEVLEAEFDEHDGTWGDAPQER